MTQVAPKPRRTETARTTAARRDPAAVTMREVAFVLAMTRRVKDAILDVKPVAAGM